VEVVTRRFFFLKPWTANSSMWDCCRYKTLVIAKAHPVHRTDAVISTLNTLAYPRSGCYIPYVCACVNNVLYVYIVQARVYENVCPHFWLNFPKFTSTWDAIRYLKFWSTGFSDGFRGVRGGANAPPLRQLVMYFCLHNCTSSSNDYAAVECISNNQAQLHTHVLVPY